jgi:SPP1 gp7 family putative phage head morphogenesis protein
LVKIARRGQELIDEIVVPELPRLERLALERADAGRLDAPPWLGVLAELFETIRARMARLIAPEFLERLSGAAVGEVSEFNKAEMTRQMRAAIGVDIFLADPTLAETVAGFVETNAALIKSIPEQLFEKVEKVIRRGFRKGQRAEQLAPEIARQFGVSDRRARFIARDQIAKLNGQLTRERQTELGLGEYIWRTSLDERVRPSHARLEGTTQSWNDPPETDGGRQVHPGEDYNCRCTAEPVIPGI